MHIDTLTPQHWEAYELIDSGGFEKLERFGEYITARPEPQAVWDKSLAESDWRKKAHAIFENKNITDEMRDKGNWNILKKMPDKWQMHYRYKDNLLKFKASLTSFKHVGVFPEQAANWDFIMDSTKAISTKTNIKVPKVLNLFAYTGIASLAARSAGAEVTHVDALKQLVTWANENREMSGLKDIRWIVEDAVKFVKREVRRGSIYQGIILDPPAYGRGANGEKWVLEEGINELVKLVAQLLDREQHFLVMNLYSKGLSAIIGANLIHNAFGKKDNLHIGELYLEDSFEKKLPLGVFCRFVSV
ncbi:class I SAM-dependent methyltransferase [Thermoflexibacter ruber]|uniref:23S rRNA (Cytosine1962-C5)-methyltransferase n=1 Tax=Thermoflexibacter ruber TaxID=1003 RepID=A0A1I2HNB9_9BACT|nr:class I SAM-dependent methyltransferase [Thermoflexibacter ruber]SFF31192.1 23S rRNA (cytosine1962-C5)-methyltransferase [Thermoflexibacter ruber]